MSKQPALKNFKLAKPVELKLEKGFPKTVKQVYKEEKLDGLRGWAIVRNGKAKLYTSGGVRVVNGPRIVVALEAMAEVPLPQGIIDNGYFFNDRCYDGEFFVKNWNDTSSIVKTQSKHPKRNRLCFRIFDTISLHEWKTRTGIDKLKRRKVNLKIFSMYAKKNLGAKFNDAVPVILGKMMTASTKNAERFLKFCVKHKHEGSVFKNPESVYPFKKTSDYGWKLKPFQDCDLQIIGYKQGSGRNSKRMGSLRCKGYFDGKLIKVSVGGGFKDEQRKMFHKMYKANKLIGIIIEMKHEGLTSKGSLRFPNFRRIRSDKKSLKD